MLEDARIVDRDAATECGVSHQARQEYETATRRASVTTITLE